MVGTPRPALRWVAPFAVCGALTTSACFGDWVSARTAPRRETLPEAPPKPDLPPAPDDPCGAYLAEVARRCDQVFDGHMGQSRCHAQIVRVMSLYHPDRASLDHGARTPDRTRGCLQHLEALPETTEPTGEPAELGPACREWAELLRDRCVAPLRTPLPRLVDCGSNLLAYESILGGVTFGRAEDYEPRCRDEVDRLTETSTAGESG